MYEIWPVSCDGFFGHSHAHCSLQSLDRLHMCNLPKYKLHLKRHFYKKRGWFQSIFLSILQLQLLVTLPKKGCMHAHRTHISKVIWYTPKTCGSVGTHCKYKYVYPISTKGISYVTLTTGNSFSVYLKFL